MKRVYTKFLTDPQVAENNVDNLISSFVLGYPNDEKDPNTVFIHSLKLRLLVAFPRQRKAYLHIEQISSNSIIVDFCFFGSEFDAPEWNQVGVRKDEYVDFKQFLIDMFEVYDFIIGGISWEEDVKFLFGCNEVYPNECYQYQNISPDYFFQNSSYFTDVIWNQKYMEIEDIRYPHTRLDDNAILITFREM
ncbi:hypothetical protein [Paenibacillus agricola]|uniref:Uncharacterized protein n=1 Tax=Paenibacillus agricola TaxID=2716264 RepID=A0ABX0JLI2_9BACL|nr:hypothetical protein [Paenibacillus agricola]NHN34875.1 hypothetical protein [Paenibacillus agricola]